MDEVALLLAVLEDHRPLAVGQAGREDGQHAGVGVRKRLAGAVDVPQPKRGALHAVGGRQRQSQPLLNELPERIDRVQARALPLRRGLRDQRPSLVVLRVPPAVGGARGADHVLVELAVEVAIQALAVDAHGRRDHDPANRPLDQLLEQHRRAVIIDRGVAVDRIHALADPDFCGEVDDAVDPLQRLQELALVAYVGDDQLRIAVQALGPALPLVDLLDERVEKADLAAALEQRLGHMAADEPGAACNENGLLQVCPRISGSRLRRSGRCAASHPGGRKTWPDSRDPPSLAVRGYEPVSIYKVPRPGAATWRLPDSVVEFSAGRR